MPPVIEEEKVESGVAATETETADVRAGAPARRGTAAERAVEAAASDVITSPESLPFDRVSRQRLLVAQAAADTFERLNETGAWENLEPALARHLVLQARRLSAYVEGLTKARPVRASEPALLLLRRLERRLQIAADLVEDDEERRTKESGGLFLGDFSEEEADAAAGGQRKSAKGKGQSEKQKKAAKADASAARRGRWASKAEKLAALRESRRVMTYLGVGFAVVAGALVFRGYATIDSRPMRATPPPMAFEHNQYLSDVQIFVPATFTAKIGNDLSVVISKEWLLRNDDQRVKDVSGAAVFLLNRNIRRVRFTWEDGTAIVIFDKGVPKWF